MTTKQVKHLTRDAILSRKDLKTEVMEVPEWDGTITIREMTASEREVFEKRVMSSGAANVAGVAKNLGDLRASVVAMCVVDEDGKRLFSDQDVKALNEKSSIVIARIFQRCSILSGISQEAVDTIVGESE